MYSRYHAYQCLLGKKTTQYYDGSKDNLIYRSASYRPGAAASADGGMPDTSQLRKMTEK